MNKFLLSCSFLLGVTAVNAQTQRVPLFEVFTSSTCGPCKAGNTVYEGVVSTKPAADYVSVKFQQNFPGTGDPYCTSETVNRRATYYAINSIPRMEIDGGWDLNAQSFTSAIYDQYRAVPAAFTLSGTYTISLTTKVVTAKVKYSPLTTAAGTGARLFVAIVEETTVNNVKTNGETKFENVVKKMLPTETGTAIPTMAANAKDSLTLTYTFAGAYRLPATGETANRINLSTEHSVENFAKLKVVAWVQGSDKKVHQAANLAKAFPTGIAEAASKTVAACTIFPNPAANMVNVNLDMTSADNVTAMLVDLKGAVVLYKTADLNAGKNQISFDTQSLAAGMYNMIVLDSKNNSFAQNLVVAH